MIELTHLLNAWQALDQGRGADGWRLIMLNDVGAVKVCAGRRFPEDKEAVILGFSSAQVPNKPALPSGKGFEVERLSLDMSDNQTRVWIGLSRKDSGNLEIFTLMAADLLSALSELSSPLSGHDFQTFMSRVYAWQDFMTRGGDGPLGPEQELGLYGELVFLSTLLDFGLPEMTALEGWQGPLGGLQDFFIGHGAIEVKSSAAAEGFTAKIGNLAQLDPGEAPLFVAAVRLAVDGANGVTLPELAETVRVRFAQHTAARAAFENLLLAAGLLAAHTPAYSRKFEIVSTRLVPVTEEFPKLISANVPSGVVKARYEIEIADTLPETELKQVMAALGVE